MRLRTRLTVFAMLSLLAVAGCSKPKYIIDREVWMPAIPEAKVRGHIFSIIEFDPGGWASGVNGTVQTGPYALEAGWDRTMNPGNTGSDSYHVRLGVAPPLVDLRDDDGAGFELEFGVMAGYRHYDLKFEYEEDTFVEDVFHMFTANFSLEAIYWFWRYTGISIRFITTISVPMGDDAATDGDYRLKINSTQRLGGSLGLVF